MVTITIDEQESADPSVEILKDRDLMTQIKNGKRKNVKSRDFEEVAKEMDI